MTSDAILHLLGGVEAEHAAALPRRIDAGAVRGVNVRYEGPEPTRLEALNFVKAGHAKAQRRRLAGTVGDERRVEVSVLALEVARLESVVERKQVSNLLFLFFPNRLPCASVCIR